MLTEGGAPPPPPPLPALPLGLSTVEVTWRMKRPSFWVVSGDSFALSGSIRKLAQLVETKPLERSYSTC